ncbi:hypothetical protein PL10110_200102 [Planktothrix agardhii]|nr:hypothetical protein PL10110_200102 [Planktothrix agardhii]
MKLNISDILSFNYSPYSLFFKGVMGYNFVNRSKHSFRQIPTD